MSSDEVTLDGYLEAVFIYLVCKTIGQSFNVNRHDSCWLT